MDVVDLPLVKLREVPWNPNVMDDHMLARLRKSITQFGLIENLVVRAIGRGEYEVLSGNQRLHVLKESGTTLAPCVVVDIDDAHAHLLAQALNRIQGEDDVGLKAELVRHVLESLPEQEVLDLLPETSETLQALATLGKADLAEHLQAWEQARAARLEHIAGISGRLKSMPNDGPPPPPPPWAPMPPLPPPPPSPPSPLRPALHPRNEQTLGAPTPPAVPLPPVPPAPPLPPRRHYRR